MPRFTATAEIWVDIEDIWDDMSHKEQREFIKEQLRSQYDGGNFFKEFAYELDDEDAKELYKWLKFYNKILKE